MNSAEYFKKNKEDLHLFIALAHAEDGPLFWDCIKILDALLDRMDAAGVQHTKAFKKFWDMVWAKA